MCEKYKGSCHEEATAHQEPERRTVKGEAFEKERFPADVIRLNATLAIKELGSGNEITLRILLPEFADINHKKITVLAPMGTAPDGLQKGQRFAWKVPAGIKNFLILDVEV